MIILKTVLMWILTFSIVFNVHASSDNNSVLLEQINDVENTLSQENEELKTRIAQLEKRISKFSSDIASMKSTKEDIEEKYKEILKKEATFSLVQEGINENELSIIEIKTNATNLKADQIKLEGNIDSSQKIITWVTLIVTVVVVLIGAFFSKSFIELYSNYRVVCARYPEVKPLDQSTDV